MRGNFKHGVKDPDRKRIYAVWSNMHRRCTDERTRAFKDYGGRGIRVSQEWETFDAFYTWAKKTGYSPELSLDRIDNDSDYAPDNCRWADRSTQSLNRRTTLRLEWDGKTQSLAEWVCDPRCVVNYHTAYTRIRKGWPVERALTQPARPISGRR